MERLREALERIGVVTEAKSWLGTPYHHGAGVKQAGADCAYLLVRVYSAVGLTPDLNLGFYKSGKAALREGEVMYREMVGRFMEPIVTPPALGDVVLFRFLRATHGGIVINWPMIIHAFQPVNRVVVSDVERNSYLAKRVDSFWRPKNWK